VTALTLTACRPFSSICLRANASAPSASESTPTSDAAPMTIPSVERKVRTGLARIVSSPMRIDGSRRGICIDIRSIARSITLRQDDTSQRQRGADRLPRAEELAEENQPNAVVTTG
jgi:hypothetical protein